MITKDWVMEKNEKKKFVHLQEEILDNLDTLLARVDLCTERGMKDYGASIYNRILELEEDIGGLETNDELEMIIVRAMAIETEIDTWLSSQGESTIGLNWPETSI